MFRNSIRNTALVTEGANDFFNGVVEGNAYLGDLTFLSTLRGIVYPRMKEGERVVLNITSSNERKGYLERYDLGTLAETAEFYPTYWGGPSVTHIGLHVFDASNDEDNDAWLTWVEEKLLPEYDKWEKLPKVTAFFQKISGFKCICICDTENHNVMLYVKNLTMQRYHYMQCGILAYLPWYFNKEDGISPEEMEMIEGLRVKDPAAYLESCRKFAAKLDLETARVKKLLGDIETRLDRETVENVRNSIQSKRNDIQRYQESIAQILNDIRKMEIQYEGLQVKIASGETGSGIMDFFLANKNALHLNRVDGNSISVQVTAYCDFFDEDLAEKVIENKRSFVYRSTEDMISADDIEALMRAVFIDRKIRLRFCAEYQIDLNSRVRPRGGASFLEGIKDTYMPNPHVNQYNCIGSYERIMTDYMSRGDNVGAITQCIASCGSLNFSDGTVMEYFMSCIAGRRDVNVRAFELPDGTVVDPNGAIEWLKKEENK